MNKIPIKEKVKQYLLELDNRHIPLGFGGGALANMGGDSTDYYVRLLMKAYEIGFRYFDTAARYNDSEVHLGEFIKRIPRKSIFLATKSHLPVIHETNKSDFEKFKTNFYRSFERLQTDHIDLFQIHDTNNYDCCVEKVIPFLQEKRDEGLISYIGMGTRYIDALRLGVISGNIDSTLSYLNYSIIKQAAKELIQTDKEYGAAFINASTMHRGIFTVEDIDSIEYTNRQYEKENVRKMRNLCEEMGISIIAVALQFSLFNPNIDITLNGIPTLSILSSTVECLRMIIYPEQWAKIYDLQAQDPYMYIQDNMELRR